MICSNFEVIKGPEFKKSGRLAGFFEKGDHTLSFLSMRYAVMKYNSADHTR